MTHPFSVYLFLLRQTYLLAYLETVETFAIDTDDGTLADKGGRIYLIDKTEYLLRLTLTRQYKKHVDILATVTAMTIHHRTTSVGGCIDGCTELQIFVADDEKLFAIAVREAFNHRRKTLRAIFKKSPILPAVSEQQLIDWGLNPMARPETLSVADFVTLANGMAQAKSTAGMASHPATD